MRLQCVWAPTGNHPRTGPQSGCYKEPELDPARFDHANGAANPIEVDTVSEIVFEVDELRVNEPRTCKEKTITHLEDCIKTRLGGIFSLHHPRKEFARGVPDNSLFHFGSFPVHFLVECRTGNRSDFFAIACCVIQKCWGSRPRVQLCSVCRIIGFAYAGPRRHRHSGVRR